MSGLMCDEYGGGMYCDFFCWFGFFVYGDFVVEFVGVWCFFVCCCVVVYGYWGC